MIVLTTNKYGAKRVDEDGYAFDSKAEHRRYRELKLMLAAGEIFNLQVHPRFELTANGMRIGYYTADFRYTRTDDESEVIEDVKSSATRTEAYRLRKKLMRACWGYDVQEVTA